MAQPNDSRMISAVSTSMLTSTANTGTAVSSSTTRNAPKPNERFQQTPVILRHEKPNTMNGTISEPNSRHNSVSCPRSKKPTVKTSGSASSISSRVQQQQQQQQQGARTPQGSPIRSILGVLVRQISNGSMRTPTTAKRPRTASQSTSRSLRGSQYVIVTDSMSIVPSLASTMSLEKTLPNDLNWHFDKPFGDIESQPVSASVQQLENKDIYDNPSYLDTVKSTDSNSSLLRRTSSIPHDYHFHPYQNKKPTQRHCREIFADFLPPEDKMDHEEMDEVRELMRTTDRKQWKKTMEDLLEQPEYTDTAESSSSRTGLLAKFARAVASGELKADDLPTGLYDELNDAEYTYRPTLKQEKRTYWKNLIILSVSFMLVFTSYLSLRNLQSSLNHESGLGLYSLSSVYAFLFVGCMFATTVVQKLRPKTTMTLMLQGFLLYIIANFYPQIYTLIPVSALVGFCLAGLWTAHATYLTNISIRYAELTEEPLPNVLSKFNGIFYSFFQCSQIIGGLISSLVLVKEPVHHMENSNHSMEISVENAVMDNISMDLGVKDVSMCGAAFCHSDAVANFSVDIDKKWVYMLVGIYTGLAALGVILLITCLEKLEGIMTRKSSYAMKDQFLAVFRFFFDWKAKCLVFLMFYSLMQVSFMFGEFTKSYVTCSTGVHMVGYAMLCMSACGALSSCFNGRIQKYVGATPLLLTAALIHMILYVVMLLWKPTGDSSSVPIFFVITGAWGMADGIFLTQTISLFGNLFSDNKEPAFAALKMCQALGACLLFVLSPYLCTQVKIYMLMSVLTLAMVGYITLVVGLKRENRLTEKELVGSPVDV